MEFNKMSAKIARLPGHFQKKNIEKSRKRLNRYPKHIYTWSRTFLTLVQSLQYQEEELC